MREGASSGASLRSGSLPRAETTSGSLMIDDLRHALDAEPLELAVIVFALILCATTWLGSEACCQRGKGRYAALVGERRILRRRESVSTKGAEDADADADADVDADADADTSSGAPASTSAAYRHVRNKYLAVYLLATFGDWIQGGYLYALYAEYGYSRWQNALLNIVGYVSAATNGTYVGALGDVRGHRRNCVLFGIVYAASCALAASSGSVLSLVSSRVLGGLAYSILYTSFESWLNAEAEESNLRPDELASLFSGCTFGSAISAVVAGIIGHVSLSLTWLAQPWSVRSSDGQMPHADHPSQVGISQVGISPMGGENRFAPPFRVAAVALLGVSALAATLWRERWGDGTHASAAGALITSWSHIRRGGILMTLGMVNACYETALYVFVFMWTPALERRAERAMGRAHEMSHGLVFAGFMLCKMAGAQGFAVISARGEAAPEKVLRVVCLGAAACIAVPIFSDNYEVTFLAFCLFEVLLGVYLPSIAILRARCLDHAQRASTMSLFRCLLNVLVVGVLLLAGKLPERLVFSAAVALLLICFGGVTVLSAQDLEGGRVGWAEKVGWTETVDVKTPLTKDVESPLRGVELGAVPESSRYRDG